MSLEKLKLSKSLLASMREAGYLTATEVQQKVMPRIVGGQNIITVAPDGAGKTTSYVLGALMRLKYTDDEAPKVLILLRDKEKVDATIGQIKMLGGNRDLRVVGLAGSGGMEEEISTLMDGAEIVVATPPRARAVYLKLGLNLNKLQQFIVDDAEELVKAGMQLPVCELARSAGKCQYLAFTTVIQEKVSNMLDQFMEFPAIIEVDRLGAPIETHALLLYQVADFYTKVSLLKMLLADTEVFDKVVVFVNTRLTAQKLAEAFLPVKDGEYAVLNPLFYDEDGFDDIEDFKVRAASRVLIVANEGNMSVDLTGIPFVIHFDVPEQKEIFLERILKHRDEDRMVLTFATAMELIAIKKIEQSIGFRMPLADLPEALIKSTATLPKKGKVKKVSKEEDALAGNGAFHEKKASNAKTFNYGIGQKAIMNKKKKHG